MRLHFYKYQGTGNDFIIIDNFINNYELNVDQIKLLCDRKFGVGGDGLMIIRKHSKTDFEMLYFNSDGLPGSMCGNGGRCLVQFAYSRNYISDQCSFIASDGSHEATIDKVRNWISLKMSDVSTVDVREDGNYFVNTGSPHIVKWVDNVQAVDVRSEGADIRYSPEFKKEGTNVNFVQVSDVLSVRSYERGVEDETLSCGTGVTASVLAAAFTNRIFMNPTGTKVITSGGELKVKFERNNNKFINIRLEGPAQLVFEGTTDI